jgi:hypothetical protein
MPAAFPVRWQFDQRFDTTNKRLAVALVISLIIHALAYTGWRVAPAAAALVKSAIARVLPKAFSELQPERKLTEPQPKREVPLVFVEVDPALASPVPPKETQNYSTHDSIAANEQPKKADVPKIEGTQTHVLRTTDNAKPQPKPMQPAPTPAPDPKAPEPQEPEPKPKAAPEVGDLALAKPQPKSLEPNKSEGDSVAPKPREKPRTLREAMQRNPTLAGQKMQQEGGVQKRAHVSMLDAKGSPFGNYDNVFIAMVQERWYNLLENNHFMMDRRGKVVLTFRLHFDGRITQLEEGENGVGDVLGLLCQKAILDPSPFPKWPTEMRQRVGLDYRDVRFTFYYD